MRMTFLKDTAGVFKAYIYANNRKVVPSSATITIYQPSVTTKMVDAAAMTIGADGLLSYTLSAGNNTRIAGASAVYNSHRVVVNYVYNGETLSIEYFYDVVNAKLTNLLTDADVVAELPQLKDNGYKITGTAKSGTVTTIVDSDIIRYPDSYFTGGLAYSIAQDLTREITGFVSSTGTVTTTAFPVAIATDKYILSRSYTVEILRAFEKVEDLLIRMGKRPYLILDPADLKEVHLCYSVSEICKGMATASDSNNFWWQMWKDYEAKAYAIFKSINFKYDEFDDGVILPNEDNKRFKSLTTGRN